MSNQSNWLIRTKQHKILGPVSKQKIIELLEKGSLTAEDELCSGNGYWFWVKESDLVEKYIKLNQTQNFNPISEAQTIYALTNSNLVMDSVKPKEIKEIKDSLPEETLIPEESDLEYPDPEDFKNIKIDHEKLDLSVDKVENIKPSLEAVEVENEDDLIFPENEDLEYPEISGRPIIENTGELVNLLEDEKLEDAIPHKNILIEKKVSANSTNRVKKKRIKKVKNNEAETQKVKEMKKNNNKIFIYITILMLSLLLYAVYFYYTSILGKTIVDRTPSLIEVSYAQQAPLLQKKK